MSAYEQLKQRFARHHAVEDASGMLGWDFQTMMPKGAASARGETLAALAGLAHQLLTAPEMADLLEAAEADPPDRAWDRANLAEMRRLHAHATAVPGDLVEAASVASTQGEMVWRTARADNDFPALQPALTRILDLQREIAAAKADALDLSPYDALLDQFEPGGRSAEIDRLFDDLADFLPGFLEEVLAHQAKAPAPLQPEGPFPEDRQKALAERLMRRVGFDFDRGRLDVSLHPFCGGGEDDVRITTRYAADDFTSALMGVLHETGHALYEQGRPADWRTQPVGKARGMTLHESQSLLIEMQASRSKAFIGFVQPELQHAFGDAVDTTGPAWSRDNLERLYHRVDRSLIRVDADEVTYPGHVILRYRLERAMLAGDLAVADLPGAWADGMTSLIGIAPPDDRTGCLQDIHWPAGAWGYFPTYTLGALAAAQLFAAALEACPEIPTALASGDFQPLLQWLRDHVHRPASSAPTDAILTAATGRPLDTAAFKRHLRTRYLGLDGAV